MAKKYKRIGWVVETRKSKKDLFCLNDISMAPNKMLTRERFFDHLDRAEVRSNLYWSEKHQEWCVGDQFDCGLVRYVPVYVEVSDG